jgi:lipid-binding SYLF domain-containing protein
MAAAWVVTAQALDKLQLDQRVRALAAKFRSLQGRPDKCIPADTLRKAQGVLLLDGTKAGLVFAYQGGGGAALVRDPNTGEWSPCAFVSANQASLGLQIGGEQNFFVILLMDTNATRLLTESNFDFGGEARGTACDASTGVEGSVNQPGLPVLVYQSRRGLYGGAAIRAGAIAPANNANRVYYEQFVTMTDILFDKKVKPSLASQELAATLTAYAQGAKP